MKELDNIALITGFSGGIGSQIAIKLAKEGIGILGHYGTNDSAANSMADEIRQIGVECILLKSDLSAPTETNLMLKKISEELKLKPRYIVNNAGITVDSLFTMIEDDTFDKIMKVNTYSPFYIMKWAARYMSRARMGSIINISSISGQIGNPGQATYSASKAALMTLSKTLAKELASRNVRVNTIAAGLINTSMVNEMVNLEGVVDHIPMKRMGTVEEIANIVYFLISENSSYITGQTINANGGLYTP